MGEVADAFSGPEVHREIGDVDAVKLNLAGIGVGQADNDVKSGGFAGPVGSEQANDLALSDLKANIINNLAALVGFRDLSCGESLHCRSWCDAVL